MSQVRILGQILSSLLLESRASTPRRQDLLRTVKIAPLSKRLSLTTLSFTSAVSYINTQRIVGCNFAGTCTSRRVTCSYRERDQSDNNAMKDKRLRKKKYREEME